MVVRPPRSATRSGSAIARASSRIRSENGANDPPPPTAALGLTYDPFGAFGTTLPEKIGVFRSSSSTMLPLSPNASYAPASACVMAAGCAGAHPGPRNPALPPAAVLHEQPVGVCPVQHLGRYSRSAGGRGGGGTSVGNSHHVACKESPGQGGRSTPLPPELAVPSGTSSCSPKLAAMAWPNRPLGV
jgi:hypothetical protein